MYAHVMSTVLSSLQLEALAAVCDAGSFEEAARTLHVTPSALSQRIASLERDLGRVLVRRTRPTRATTAGEDVLRVARQTLLLHAECREELSGHGAGPENERDAPDPSPVQVAVAINADSLATWFTVVLESVAVDQSMVLRLTIDDEDRTADLLRSGEVMAAVTTDHRPVQGCSTLPLGEQRYVAVCSPDLLERRRVTASEPHVLARLPMLQFDGVDELELRLAESAGVQQVERSHLVPTSSEYLTAVRVGLGWGVVPLDQVGPLIDDGTLVRLSPEHVVDVALFWQRWKLASTTLDRLTDSVHAAARASLSRPSPTRRGVGP